MAANSLQSGRVQLSSQSISLSNLVLGGSQFITMIPSEDQVTPSIGSLQTTVPAGGQGRENLPWKAPFFNCGLLCSFKHGVVRASSGGVGALPSSIPRVCVTTRLRTWLRATSKFTPGIGQANPQASRLVVRWYVREAGNFSAAMETGSGQQLSPEGIETPDGSLFLRVDRLTLDLPRWVHKGGLWNLPC